MNLIFKYLIIFFFNSDQTVDASFWYRHILVSSKKVLTSLSNIALCLALCVLLCASLSLYWFTVHLCTCTGACKFEHYPYMHIFLYQHQSMFLLHHLVYLCFFLSTTATVATGSDQKKSNTDHCNIFFFITVQI